MIAIALGGNIASQAGPPARTLDAALRRLEKSGANILRVSPYYVTPAWPDPNDPPFVNAVAVIDTRLQPAALLALLHDVETVFGRIRSVLNAPRTLDLDLLDYHGLIQQGPPELPHPRLGQRAFVLVPLADVAPDWTHPVTGRRVLELLAALPKTERDAIEPISSA
jgi:2-amino-4-hydroxy-6-hydroxymethyldihydropteridine diphosphokinase